MLGGNMFLMMGIIIIMIIMILVMGIMMMVMRIMILITMEIIKKMRAMIGVVGLICSDVVVPTLRGP